MSRQWRALSAAAVDLPTLLARVVAYKGSVTLYETSRRLEDLPWTPSRRPGKRAQRAAFRREAHQRESWD